MPYTKNYPGGWQNGAGGATPIEKAVLDHLETQYDEAIKTVLKVADETINNSNVLQNDDELLFAMAANEVWEFTLWVNFTSSAVADFAMGYSVPVGAVLHTVRITDEGGVVVRIDANPTSAAGAGATQVPILVHGHIVNGANAGNFQIRWAQSTAEVSDTKVLIGSSIVAHKLT